MKLTIEFKLQDMWVGAYWRKLPDRFDLWVCIVPCFPIHFVKEKPRSPVNFALQLNINPDVLERSEAILSKISASQVVDVQKLLLDLEGRDANS